MADEPKFYSKNRIDSASTIVVSSGDATKGRLYDRDTELQWVTSGENSDANPADAQIDFKADGIAISRKVDAAIFLNWNVKSGKLQEWTGAAFADITGGGFSAQAASYLVKTFTQVDTLKIKAILNDTQTPNQEKKLGELILLETLLTFSADRGFASLSQARRAVAIVNVMSDGGQDISLQRWAGNRVERWRARASFRFMTKTELDSVLTLYKLGDFYVQPEPTQRPDRFFHVTPILRDFPEEYTDPNWKGRDYNHDMELVEV